MSNENNRESKKSLVWKNLSTSLIGLKVCVVKGSSKDWEGIKGIIKDETSNLLQIDINGKIISIPKKHQIFELVIEDGLKVLIEGYLLEGTPDQRIKKRLKKW